jgi:hypothetical protein
VPPALERQPDVGEGGFSRFNVRWRRFDEDICPRRFADNVGALPIRLALLRVITQVPVFLEVFGLRSIRFP